MARRFYALALEPLGIQLVFEPAQDTPKSDLFAGFGRGESAFFRIAQGGPVKTPVHIAFQAQTRDEVEQFYAMALAAGGICNGAPGLRPIYDEDYFAAFIHDPDGHNIEAVCRSK